MARMNLPWWRKSHRRFYVKYVGQLVRLAADEGEAFRLWHRLEAGLAQPPASGPSLASLIDGYLADVGKRLKPSGMSAKRTVLLPHRAERGDVAAERFDADALMEYLQRYCQ